LRHKLLIDLLAKKATRTGKPTEDPIFSKKQEPLRWSRFKKTAPEQMFETVQQGSSLSSRPSARGATKTAKATSPTRIT